MSENRSIVSKFTYLFKVWLSVVVTMTAALQIHAQVEYEAIGQIKASIQSFTTDPFRNIYVINEDDEVIKYNDRGDLLYRFGIRENGPIHKIDASNPFKIIVFYEETNQMVVLDNTLSEISRTDLFDLDLLSVSALCSSSNDEIWFFDRFNQRLVRINNQFEVSKQGENLNETFENDLEPNFMLEYEDALYVNDSTQGIFIFDAFGNFQKRLNIQGLASFQITNDQLIYFSDGRLKIHHLKLLSDTFQSTPTDIQADDIRVHDERLYVLDTERLHLYSF